MVISISFNRIILFIFTTKAEKYMKSLKKYWYCLNIKTFSVTSMKIGLQLVLGKEADLIS